YKELAARKFVFHHRGSQHSCEYARSSEELLTIAKCFRSTGPSTMGGAHNRNLGSFRQFLLGDPKVTVGMSPLSFWVDGLTWEDDIVLEVINHLNFYMTYFDALSPVVLVHSPRSENVAKQPQKRFAFDIFPEEIRSRSIDDNLLKFWEASRTGDPARRFLYCYQIIENFAMTYVDEKIKKNIKKILAAPNANEFLDSSSQKIIELVSESKMHDTVKVDAVLRETVDPHVIWKEISANLEFFSQKCVFEGGFSVDALAKPGWKSDDFCVSGISALSTTLRQIRNALSHAKDQRSMTVITPTRVNMEKLQSWVPLASAAASQVLIFGDLA
ncbi:MAG: hypothetical protein OJI67_10540, partial [Prosthecobacter sp.]|nr:hypothetical protein [Prosthecobacter sp.]